MLTKAVDLDPRKALYRNNLARVLVELGQPKPAFDHLIAVHGPAIAHYNMGYFHYQRQQHQEAIRHFAHAAEMDPSLVAARRMLEQLGAVPSNRRHSRNDVADGTKTVQASVEVAVKETESEEKQSQNTDTSAWTEKSTTTSTPIYSISDLDDPSSQDEQLSQLKPLDEPIDLAPVDSSLEEAVKSQPSEADAAPAPTPEVVSPSKTKESSEEETPATEDELFDLFQTLSTK